MDDNNEAIKPWEQPLNQQPTPIVQPAGKISHTKYIVLTTLTILVAIPILFFGGALTLLSPAFGDSGESVEAYAAMFLVTFFCFILPIVLVIAILKKLYKLYKPAPEKESKTPIKKSKVFIIAILLILSPFIFWLVFPLFWYLITSI